MEKLKIKSSEYNLRKIIYYAERELRNVKSRRPATPTEEAQAEQDRERIREANLSPENIARAEAAKRALGIG